MSPINIAAFLICSVHCVLAQYYPYPYINFSPMHQNFPPIQHIPQPFQYPSFNPYPYPQFFPQFNQNRNYRIEPIPYNQNNQNNQNNRNNQHDINYFPTEIIDLDENVIVPDNQQLPATQNSPVHQPSYPSAYNPVITESKHHSYSSSTNNTKGVHIFESKPISTVIRKTITSNGQDGQHVVNIHLINGVEVTSSQPETNIVEENEDNTENTKKQEIEEDDDEEESNETVEESKPKDIFNWFKPKL